MNIVLAAVNSKYVHTNLAVRKIAAYLKSRGFSASVREFSGSEELMRAAADLTAQKPDILGFSCYIWNIEYTLKLAQIVKSADNSIKIVLGGPEAAYNAESLLQTHGSFIDCIMCGEGEAAWLEIAQNGLKSEKIICGAPVSMDEMPFPYTDDDFKNRGRIFYYETSRGCPFSCSYCLSSAEKKVKYKSLENVFADLDIFAKNDVRLVKFVDRTFNSDENRSIKILEYILTLDCDTEFHIELEAATLTQQFIEVLKKFPQNRLRAEIGLQSANPDTLKAVCRSPQLDTLAENVKKTVFETNVTLHLDLIAGLPLEDMQSFKKSFDFAFSLNPHELQLGFLKVLPGTKIQTDAEKYGIKSMPFAPYEVISTSCMTFNDTAKLKQLEAALDMYHNSGILQNTEKIFLNRFISPFDFFDALAQYMAAGGLLQNPHQRTKLFDYISGFAQKLEIGGKAFYTELAKDYFLSCPGAVYPQWLEKQRKPADKQKICTVLANDALFAKLPQFSNVPPRDRHKHVRIENLYNMVWLISNKDKNIVDITPYF